MIWPFSKNRFVGDIKLRAKNGRICDHMCVFPVGAGYWRLVEDGRYVNVYVIDENRDFVEIELTMTRDWRTGGMEPFDPRFEVTEFPGLITLDNDCSESDISHHIEANPKGFLPREEKIRVAAILIPFLAGFLGKPCRLIEGDATYLSFYDFKKSFSRSTKK